MQFIRGNQLPHTVYSHDHGHFFPSGPMWSQASLAGYTTAPVPVADIVKNLKLTSAETSAGGHVLANITIENITHAVGAAPETWKVPLADRVALARFLHDRQALLVQALTPPAPAAPGATQ
jgi:hypothetical protein